MKPLSSRLRRAALPRPRLLPLTIAAMSALLATKSIVLMQAAAQEATGSSLASQPAAAASSRGTATAKSPPASAGSDTGSGVVSRQASGEQASAGSVTISNSERAVLLDLRRRRETLDARAHALDEREAELDAADRRLGERVQQLSALQVRLEGLEAGRQKHSAENWEGLVKVYEAMKPRDAAAIFDVLDMQVLLQVLDRMQARRAAPVLAAMQPDRARLATQLLAEMRTRTVTPQPVPLTPDPKG
jgi:flagellar motility protein MotE (MotC chaperone)